jgi:phage virion morphogenesis protein
MAGAFISVDVLGVSAISKEINRLLQQGQNLAPAFRDIGEHFITSTQQRFRDQESPDGEAWELLSVDTILNKALTGQSDSILRGYGTLADTLNYQLNNDQLMFGTNMEYGASHQFGRDEINLPAREFLGVSNEDETEILAILRSHLSN